MICDKCKENEATVHYKEIINGNKKEMHFCDKCANQNEINSPFSINHLFAGLLDSGFGENVKIDYKEPIKCDNCGMTYEKFKQSGKFGCSKCYSSFEDKLNPLFKRIHGHDTHRGKIPNRAGKYLNIKNDIKKLTDDLNRAIGEEEFEKAAELRDKIKNLKESIKE
jgi:protein arginine kinase activator